MAKVKTATRAVSNAGQPRTLVNIASTKAIGELPTESLVEFDGLIELIADPDIVSVQVQPQRFDLEVDGKAVQYTPDVRFVRRDGRIGFREFKDSSKPLPQEVADKLQAAAAFLADEGYEFEVRTSGELRSNHRVANFKLLKRYDGWKTTRAFEESVLAFVGDRQDLHLHDLRQHVGPDAFGALYRMLWERLLEADLTSAALSGTTSVRRGKA